MSRSLKLTITTKYCNPSQDASETKVKRPSNTSSRIHRGAAICPNGGVPKGIRIVEGMYKFGDREVFTMVEMQVQNKARQVQSGLYPRFLGLGGLFKQSDFSWFHSTDRNIYTRPLPPMALKSPYHQEGYD